MSTLTLSTHPGIASIPAQTWDGLGDGNPFTLTPEERTSGWRGGLRLIGGGSSLSFVAEANAEQQQDEVSLGGRLGLTIDF